MGWYERIISFQHFRTPFYLSTYYCPRLYRFSWQHWIIIFRLISRPDGNVFFSTVFETTKLLWYSTIVSTLTCCTYGNILYINRVPSRSSKVAVFKRVGGRSPFYCYNIIFTIHFFYTFSFVFFYDFEAQKNENRPPWCFIKTASGLLISAECMHRRARIPPTLVLHLYSEIPQNICVHSPQ